MTDRRRSGIRAGLAYFDPPLPRVLAHRGLAVDAPDNTMLAFVRALALGSSYLEIDVHATSDGVAVVSHDPDLLRLAGRATRIDALTFAELAQVDLGDGQVTSSLAEVLDGFPDARLNIDIKAADAVQPTVEAIRAARAVDRVLITSFSERRRAGAVRQLPGVATSASSTRFSMAFAAGAVGLIPVMRLLLASIDAVQIPERIRGLPLVTRRSVARLHRAGVEVHVWTVNDRADMERLLGLGVDALITDRADIAMELVARIGPK